ncbi:sulfotransferase [Halomonas sp. CH40]
MLRNKIEPFFLLGAPRSGTTMLRDLFKQIDDLYSPEETHVFRWAAPFRGGEYDSIYANNKTLKYHRELDGISNELFYELYNSSISRKNFNDKYCQKVAEIKGKKYWFEKTPQNIYGLPLIAEQYPNAKILHIIRHPYDVIKSLMVGKVIKVDEIVGAANYWAESIAIVQTLKPFLGERLVEIKYESLVTNPKEVFGEIVEKLSLDTSFDFDFSHLKYKNVDYGQYFSNEEFEIIHSICDKYIDLHNYDRFEAS